MSSAGSSDKNQPPMALLVERIWNSTEGLPLLIAGVGLGEVARLGNPGPPIHPQDRSQAEAAGEDVCLAVSAHPVNSTAQNDTLATHSRDEFQGAGFMQ